MPQVQQFVSETTVEGLDPGVLPWRSRVDEHRVDARLGAPLGDGVGHELGAVVETDEPRCPPSLGGEACECGDDTVGVDGVIDDDGQGLAGVRGSRCLVQSLCGLGLVDGGPGGGELGRGKAAVG